VTTQRVLSSGEGDTFRVSQFVAAEVPDEIVKPYMLRVIGEALADQLAAAPGGLVIGPLNWSTRADRMGRNIMAWAHVDRLADPEGGTYTLIGGPLDGQDLDGQDIGVREPASRIMRVPWVRPVGVMWSGPSVVLEYRLGSGRSYIYHDYQVMP
jgi:hypothetical protein